VNLAERAVTRLSCFATVNRSAVAFHKEATTMAKKKAKKRGKAKDLSVRKGGGVKGGKMRA